MTALFGNESSEDFPLGDAGEKSIRVPPSYLKNIDSCSDPNAVTVRISVSRSIDFINLLNSYITCMRGMAIII
jgi:hypothetical protein